MKDLVLKNGFILMILSAFFFAVTDIFIKSISPSIGIVQIAFFRFSIGAILLWPMILSTGQSLKGHSTWVLLIRGLTGTAAFFSLLASISMIPLSNAMILFYTFPLFAAFFSFIMFKERFKKIEVLLIVTGAIGIYILINPSSSNNFSIGHLFGILAGCFAGLTVVLIRKLREINGSLIIYFYFCIVGGLISFPFIAVKFTAPDFRQIFLLVILALIFLIAQLLMNQGFKFCKASEGGIILMSEVIFTGIAGVIMFNDLLTGTFLSGSFLIIASGVGLNLINRAIKRSSSTPVT
ncbi:MAG: DMT family transporter [Deltaproteobacteria bacterium]|nr:DMT family transporter [Deltaproteobacteria bacterium]